MSNHSAHEIPTTMTPQKRREHSQAECEARKQVMEALSDEELEKITGGSLTGHNRQKITGDSVNDHNRQVIEKMEKTTLRPKLL